MATRPTRFPGPFLSVRHSAARTILEFRVKLRESAELVARVAAIEAQLTGAA